MSEFSYLVYLFKSFSSKSNIFVNVKQINLVWNCKDIKWLLNVFFSIELEEYLMVEVDFMSSINEADLFLVDNFSLYLLYAVSLSPRELSVLVASDHS